MSSILVLVVLGLPLQDENVVISPASMDRDGFLVHTVRCSHQSGSTQLRVLLPSQRDGDRRHPVIFVLPVEAGREDRYGDGLVEVKNRGLHDKHNVIFVAPTFSDLPWYADHPTDPTIAQETYFCEVVVPFIDRTYPVSAEREGRMLLGFSKSGWGAWSLLLRHCDLFARAAAWDAPLMMDRLGKYGTEPIFGTEENFEQYRIRDIVSREYDWLSSGAPQLILTGYGGFHEEHRQMHALLCDHGVPHIYRDGVERKHDWHSGWVPEAVELLIDTPAE